MQILIEVNEILCRKYFWKCSCIIKYIYNVPLLSWQKHSPVPFFIVFFMHTQEQYGWTMSCHEKKNFKSNNNSCLCMPNASFSLPFYLNFNIAIIPGTVFWITRAVCNWDMTQSIHIYLFYYTPWIESSIKKAVNAAEKHNKTKHGNSHGLTGFPCFKIFIEFYIPNVDLKKRERVCYSPGNVKLMETKKEENNVILPTSGLWSYSSIWKTLGLAGVLYLPLVNSNCVKPG